MRKGSSRSEEEGEKEKEAQAGSLSGSMSAGSRTSLSSSSSSSVLLAYATSSSSDDGEPVPPPPPEVRVAPQQMLPEPQPQPQPDQQQRPDQQLRQPGRASQVSALSDFTEVMTLSRALPTAPHYYYYPPQLPPPPVRPAMSSARSIAPSVATSRSGSHAAGRGKTPRAKTYESTAPLAIALMDSLSPAPPPRTRQRKDSAPARVNAQEARAAPPLQIQILQQHYAWADPGSVPGSASTVRAPMSTVRQTLDPEPGPKRPSLPATPSRVVWKVASSSSETSSSPLEESPPPQSGLVNAESEAYVPPPPPPPPSRPARPERRYTTGRDREEDEMRAWAKAALVKRHYRTLREPDPLPPGGWGSVPRFGEGVLVFTQNR
ncbi:hypothetical protein PUNSTDRAFT_49507 [Punctularia strigosozonata HHB-11173 SS5]|uniref:uncharacterized protein n=1 Tax=Punctularia strigosozonata (strain HHB-11173) TaxID=741275 RepID=UPI0004416ECD|nr:uncharacterized protein PUNSTDRAFT_49507 [Punctularia strigosozonata HHB-11173 SS5]EIN12206.1 hypothetical protein PUNSTDRAFT_49507 [Punctularia strigosozonata HHB-11173 SS5]